MSLVSTPIGSVGISAWPVRETTLSTSGNSIRIFSIIVVLLTDSERLTLGRRHAWTAIEPSPSRGTNSAPSHGTSVSDSAKIRRAASTTACGRSTADSSSGR